ncbi:MAG: fabG3 [Actinomycetia bacterium]|nr:fabG3 [Actinomycetes bacterium]
MTAASLAGKVAIVTGGARGQGAAIATLLVEEGARVVLGDVLDAEGEARARELGPAAAFVHLDVASEADWQRATDAALERFGSIDILVNNAGILHRGSIEETSVDDFVRVTMVNQLGCWLGMKSVFPHMRANGGGAIVNTSAVAAFVPLSNRAAYVASKAAVRTLTKIAAIEFGPSNVRVNAIYPGPIATDMAGGEGQDNDAMVAGQPIARWGRPDEIAKMVRFLVSDDSSYCTGGDFLVDGGVSAGKQAP